MIRRIVRVSGRVQGVGFRMATADRAAQLEVHGTVRNLLDGTVEADVEGDDQAVAQLVEWLGHGPRSARVTSAEIREAAPRGVEGFRVTG